MTPLGGRVDQHEGSDLGEEDASHPVEDRQGACHRQQDHPDPHHQVDLLIHDVQG